MGRSRGHSRGHDVGREDSFQRRHGIITTVNAYGRPMANPFVLDMKIPSINLLVISHHHLLRFKKVLEDQMTLVPCRRPVRSATGALHFAPLTWKILGHLGSTVTHILYPLGSNTGQPW